MQVEQQLLAHGKVERGRLGITIQEVNQSLAQDFGLKQATGALVSAVEPDGAGAKAGLKAGDVILKFNGHELADSADLPPLVANVKPGEHATLSIWRNGRTSDLDIQVGGTLASASAVSVADRSAKGHLGLSLRPLTAEQRSQALRAARCLVLQFRRLQPLPKCCTRCQREVTS